MLWQRALFDTVQASRLHGHRPSNSFAIPRTQIRFAAELSHASGSQTRLLARMHGILGRSRCAAAKFRAEGSPSNHRLIPNGSGSGKQHTGCQAQAVFVIGYLTSFHVAPGVLKLAGCMLPPYAGFYRFLASCLWQLKPEAKETDSELVRQVQKRIRRKGIRGPDRCRGQSRGAPPDGQLQAPGTFVAVLRHFAYAAGQHGDPY